MDRHCSCYSPYQPSAGQVYLDYLRLTKQDDDIDERSKAHELSLRPLSASELEEHHRRKACLFTAANDRSAKFERITAVGKPAFTALHQCNHPPPATRINGSDDVRRQQFEANFQQCQPQRKPIPFLSHIANDDQGRRHIGFAMHPLPKPRPPHFANEGYGQRQIFVPSRDQRGYVEFGIADQKRRMARMGLEESRGEGTTSQTTHSPPIPKPTNHRVARTFASKEECVQQIREQLKAQQQKSEDPACGLWVRDQTERRKLAQQKREQQEARLPAAKPGSLYPGPTRIPNSLPPNHFLHGDHSEQSRRSELTLAVHLKSKMASQETDREYKEEKEQLAGQQQQQQQPKATLWTSKSEATRTEPVKQLLDGVNKALEQKVEATEAGATKTERVEHEAFRVHSQQPHKGPEDAHEAGLKCGRSFWEKYDRSYPMSGHPLSYGIRPASVLVQPPISRPDRPAGNEFARHTKTPRREVPYDSSRTSGFRAAVEAIDRTSGHLLGNTKTASDQDKVPLPKPSSAIVSPNKENGMVGIRTISLNIPKGHPTIVGSRQDAPPPPTLHAEQTDKGTELKEDDGGVEDVVEKAALGDVDIHSEWEEVAHGLDDDGWSTYEDDWSGTSSSLDLEWASDVVSEGAV